VDVPAPSTGKRDVVVPPAEQSTWGTPVPLPSLGRHAVAASVPSPSTGSNAMAVVVPSPCKGSRRCRCCAAVVGQVASVCAAAGPGRREAGGRVMEDGWPATVVPAAVPPQTPGRSTWCDGRSRWPTHRWWSLWLPRRWRRARRWCFSLPQSRTKEKRWWRRRASVGVHTGVVRSAGAFRGPERGGGLGGRLVDGDAGRDGAGTRPEAAKRPPGRARRRGRLGCESHAHARAEQRRGRRHGDGGGGFVSQAKPGWPPTVLWVTT